MRRSLLALLALLLSTLLVPSTPLQSAATQSFVPNELLVRLRPGTTLTPSAQPLGHFAANLQSTLHGLGIEHSELRIPDQALYRLQLPIGSDPRVAARELAANPAVVYAQPNYLRQMLRTPNDPAVEQQWALRNIQAYAAWDVTTGGEVTIAVVDTGVSATHPDLGGKVLPGYNAISDSGDANDDNGHGTAVSGLIAAQSDNGVGVAGMCWGCRILPVKVLNAYGSGSDDNVARGIRWAVDQGVRVINLSLGGDNDAPVLRDAVAYAVARNVLIVAASGNSQQQGNPISYPAAYPGVLGVGATDNSDAVTGFSNTGDYVDLAAPGVGLWTTIPDGQYGPPNGTSFSSPYVAGVAGLILSLRGDLGYSDIACILESSADDKGAAGKDYAYGWGRLNAFRAVQLAANYPGCQLVEPAPQPPTSVGNAPAAFAPVAPFASDAGATYFPETQHSLHGAFKRYWERNGGLPIFGFPISEELIEAGDDGQNYIVQYFERHRLEFHPEAKPPYEVQLARMGDLMLKQQGRDWFSFPKNGNQPGCRFFAETGQSICGAFLAYWRNAGLELDGRRGHTEAESLALFGLPLSQPQTEEIAPGVYITVQWFERARFEDHNGQVLLGLLGNELSHARGWR